MVLGIGDLLQGRYRISAAIGFGGMGSVFLASEEPHGKSRVVKQLRLDAPELLDAFRGEFALLSRLTHPHLVRVLDFGTERIRGEPCHYYIAEHVSGVALATRERPGSATELVRPLLDALEGLAVLHDAGIRHGDFTLSNVLVRPDGSGVLIDLGCAQPFGVSETISGTEGYLAPELLAGEACDARADLFAVGQALSRLFALTNEQPAPEVRRLIERLTREDARARPNDVRELLEAFRRRPQPGTRQVVPTQMLGRAGQVASFEAWLQGFAGERTGAPVVALSGAQGAGVSRLMRELTWRAELRVDVRKARGNEPDCIGQLLACALGVVQAITSVRGVLAAVRVLSERPEPLLLVVDDYESLATDQLDLLLALLRSLTSGAGLAVLLSGRRAPALPVLLELECGALDLSDIRAWAGGFVAERKLPLLAQSTGGLPGAIEAALRDLSGGHGAEPAAAPVQQPEVAKIRRSIATLSALARATLAELAAAAAAGESHVAADDFEPATLVELAGVRLLERDGEWCHLTRGAKLTLANGELAQLDLKAAHGRLAQRALQQERAATPAAVANLIFHLAASDAQQEAERLFLEHVTVLHAAPRAVARLLRPVFESSADARLVLDGARLMLAAREPRVAVTLAAHAGRITPEFAVEALVVISDGLMRLGKSTRLERILVQRTSAQSAPDARLLDRLARVRLARGAYREASETAERALKLAPAAFAASAHETMGIACSYLGELGRARSELALALSTASAPAARDLYRIQSHSALAAFRMGQVETALSEYGNALALAEEHDLDDVLATALLNLGTAEQQAGLWGSALRRYERALSFARAGARVDTEVTLEYNLANLYAEIGALERAEESLGRLDARALGQRLAHLGPAILLLRAEILLLRGKPEHAQRLLLNAEHALSPTGQLREVLEVRLRLLEVAIAQGALEEATERLAALTSELEAQGLRDLGLALELCAGKLATARGDASALARLEALKIQAQQESLLAFEATVAGELAAAAERLDPGDGARAHAERARRLWDRIAFDLPSALGATFWRHPRRLRLGELSRSLPASNGGEPSALRRLSALNRRLNSPHSLERVLDYALQASVDLTAAERGFLVLCQPSKFATDARPELVVRASSEPEGLGREPSQSILRRVVDRQEAVLTTDAQSDPRFAAQGSVHALQLKSVLCVPIIAASGTLGALYVDSRVQQRRFLATDRELLLAFADQVAVAIGNKLLLEQVEQQRELLERQKLALEQAARGHVQEVERLRREVQSQQQTLELRYDYAQIVGRGPAMRRVLERLDRVTDSTVNVLILGESGTGKELVARAIHWNGPRKAGPFLGINCAALPESLLESELFGHVRGAFTGADRDKIGLLQAANGGTLFLDEIGELPLPTQAKLLRVLQEREVRPLGATTSVALDLRLLAATHRDLGREAASGAFREDLFYRLAVVTVQVPALRDRLEDLPLLAHNILENLARDTKRPKLSLASDALRKLSTHPFRGNVRELQNILTRAFVLAPGARIRAQDIDFGAGTIQARRSESREEFERQERERILEALHSARWNVTAVAETLGMPRITLHRKLKRYGILRTRTSARRS